MNQSQKLDWVPTPSDETIRTQSRLRAAFLRWFGGYELIRSSRVPRYTWYGAVRTRRVWTLKVKGSPG